MTLTRKKFTFNKYFTISYINIGRNSSWAIYVLKCVGCYVYIRQVLKKAQITLQKMSEIPTHKPNIFFNLFSYDSLQNRSESALDQFSLWIVDK